MKKQTSMMFGESLLIENSVDTSAAQGGAGSKLDRISELTNKAQPKELEKIPS